MEKKLGKILFSTLNLKKRGEVVRATIVVCLMLLLGSSILSAGTNVSFRDSNSHMADIPAEVHIAKPKEGYLYVADREIIYIGITLIMGEITVETEGDVNSVMFYVDGELKAVDYDEPYSWLWDEHAVGKHKIVVIAYDEMGKMASDQMQIKIFNI